MSLRVISLSPLGLKLPPAYSYSVKHYWATRTALSNNVVDEDSQCLAVWSGEESGPSVI